MSITPYRYDFRPIKRSFDFAFQFHWGFDLLGSTISVLIWDRKRQSIISTMNTNVKSLDPGHTIHSLTHAQTALIEVGNYDYELVRLAPDGSKDCYMDGIMPFVNFTSR